jgi:RES domain-containing protein
MRVFRIAAAQFARSRKQAFSGEGGLRASGRWHTAGRPIVYTAQSLSLAALEILVHLKQTNDIRPFRAFTLDIPDDLIVKPASFPAAWRAQIKTSRAYGDRWLEGGAFPALLVPSAISRGEWNVLLNPRHRQFALKWVVKGPVTYSFDARLLERR